MPPDNELMNELKRAWVGSGRYLVNHIIIRDWRFALPELAALAAGDISLWAWPLLIILIFPIAIVFAVLGRHFPHAGGVAHFVGMAFGPRLQRVISWLFYQSFLLVFPQPCILRWVSAGRCLAGKANSSYLGSWVL